jgi:PhnB protein
MTNQAVPYLSFNGNAKDALSFYKEVFDGEITKIQTYGEADFPTLQKQMTALCMQNLKKAIFF